MTPDEITTSRPLRLMAVMAHPDDESLGIGGTLATYAAHGVETYLVTLARCRGLCPGMEPAFGLCFRGRLWDDRACGVPCGSCGRYQAAGSDDARTFR